MRRSISLSIATLALVIASSAALAQSGQVAAGAIRREPVVGTVKSEPATLCCLSKLTPEEAARLDRRIEEASALTFDGRMIEARRILRSVVSEQERADAYPAVALRLLANVEFSLDRPIAAADILVRLADAAATAGDPNTELQALVDATVLYDQSGRRSVVRSLRPRIRGLLNSPAIPEATRQQLARRLAPE